MKRRILYKTTSFHVEKKEKEQNSVVQNDIVPLDMQQGKADFSSSSFFIKPC